MRKTTMIKKLLIHCAICGKNVYTNKTKQKTCGPECRKKLNSILQKDWRTKNPNYGREWRDHQKAEETALNNNHQFYGKV